MLVSWVPRGRDLAELTGGKCMGSAAEDTFHSDQEEFSVVRSRISHGGSTIEMDEGTLRVQPFKPSGSKNLRALVRS